MDVDPRTLFVAERATYERRKSAWLAAGAEGKWVTIKGRRALGPFRDCGRAWKAGVLEFKAPGTFIVREVVAEEGPLVTQRGVLRVGPAVPQPSQDPWEADPRTLFVAERATFERRRAAWLAAGAAGRWVAIKGKWALGPFSDCGRAWQAGLLAFRVPGTFMVRMLRREDGSPSADLSTFAHSSENRR